MPKYKTGLFEIGTHYFLLDLIYPNYHLLSFPIHAHAQKEKSMFSSALIRTYVYWTTIWCFIQTASIIHRLSILLTLVDMRAIVDVCSIVLKIMLWSAAMKALLSFAGTKMSPTSLLLTFKQRFDQNSHMYRLFY